jgi:hypothetical protein
MKPLHKARAERTQYYGYAVSRDWLKEYGLKHSHIEIGPNTNVSTNAVYNALKKITLEARLGKWTHVKKDEHDTHRSLTCFAVGHNRSQEGREMITQERIDRLKEVIGTSEEPRWWTT